MRGESLGHVAALVVSRGRSADCSEVLRAIAEQTVAPASVTVVDVAGRGAVPWDATALPEGVRLVRVGRAKNLGDAIRRAVDEVSGSPGAFTGSRWWWVLHDDSAPESTCLARLWRVAQSGRTIGAVGPKQLSWDGSRLLEVGVFATRSARRLERVRPDEIDQGQYDGTTDVLGVGTAGMLIDSRAWAAVGGTDPALGPFGDGLDLGRRLHLAGYRVVAAPGARLRHRRRSLAPASDPGGDGPPQDPDGRPGRQDEDASFRRRRRAQLYNWMKAVPAWQVPLLMAWLVIWSPARALGRVVTGAGHLALAEVGAWLSVVLATGQLLVGRFRASRTRTVPRSALRALETRPRSLAREPEAAPDDYPEERIDPLVESSQRRYRLSATAALLGALAVASIGAALTWWGSGQGFAGGAWAGLPSRWTDLWEAAWGSWIPGGDGYPAPPDPLLVPLAVLSWPLSLIGATPGSLAASVLVAAAPLAVLAAWPATRLMTSSPPLRALLSLLWACLPPLVLSQFHGQLAGVAVHLAVPVLACSWARLAGADPQLVVDGAGGPTPVTGIRLRGAHGRAALAAAVIAAAAPWALIATTAAGIAVSRRRGAGGSRPGGPLLATLVPAWALLAPTLGSIAAHPAAWRALAATGGGAHAHTPAQGWQAALGLAAAPASQVEAWALALPFALLALWAVGAALGALRRGDTRPSGIAGLALMSVAAAHVLSLLPVGQDGGAVVRAWSAPALTLACALFALALARSARPSQEPWDSAALKRTGRLALAACLVPLLAIAGGAWERSAQESAFAGASTYTMSLDERVHAVRSPLVPAVSAQAALSARAGRILVLTGSPSDTLTAQIWRGNGRAMTEGSPLTRALALARSRAAAQRGAIGDPATASLAGLALTLVVYPDEATATALADHGIDTILVPLGAPGGDDIAQGLARAPGLEKVGDTDAGAVWRLRPDGAQSARVRILATGGGWANVGSTNLTTDGAVEASGPTIALAERADSGWRATLDGRSLDPVASADGWSQSFALAGAGRLTIVHRAWWTYPWWAVSGLALVVAAAGSVPLRRRS